MSGGKNRQPLGYTIIEVMIVLAISGLMFIIATQFIGGRQERTAFTDGVNQMASQIQDVVEQVSDGRYSDVPLSCTPPSGPGGTTNATYSSSSAQGQDPRCVFVGKVLQFQLNQGPYEVISLAGGRLDPTTSGNIGDLAALNAEHPAAITDLTVNQNVPQGLTIKKLTLTAQNGSTLTSGDGLHNYYFGFVQGAGTVNSSSFEGGAAGLSLIYISENGGVNAFNDAQIGQNAIAYANSVTICLTDGTRFANVNIGSSSQGSDLNASVDREVTSCS